MLNHQFQSYVQNQDEIKLSLKWDTNTTDVKVLLL